MFKRVKSMVAAAVVMMAAQPVASFGQSSSESTFIRITGMSEFTSGANYAIVYHSNSANSNGVQLVGGQYNWDKAPVTSLNYKLDVDQSTSFKITSTSFGYSMKNQTGNQYLTAYSWYVGYSNEATYHSITDSNDGFTISKNQWNICYDNGFTTRSLSTGLVYLYKQVSLSFPNNAYSVNEDVSFTAPTLTKSASATTVTYSSSNTAVATVNASTGAVTVKGAGETIITATYKVAKGSVSASYKLTVKSVKKSANLQFTTSKGAVSAELYVNGTDQTKVTRNGEGVVSYSSSNTSVATISASGLIEAHAVGETTITASVASTEEYSAQSKTITVKVSLNPIVVTPSFTTTDIQVGKSVKLMLTTESKGDQHFVSSDESIAQVDENGNIYGVSEGTATISYKVDSDGVYEASDLKTVTVNVHEVHKSVPVIETDPSVIALAIGSTKVIKVMLKDYQGTVSAVTENYSKAFVASWERDEDTYTLAVTATEAGETKVILTAEENSNYYGKTFEIPVTVLSLYEYQLEIVNAPKTGVSVEIFGASYTSDAIFNSARSKIGAAEVHVQSLASYSSKVTVSGRKITVTYSLKVPTPGCFLRIRNFSSDQYASVAGDGNALAMGALGVSNIIYYDENKRLLFYQNGKFVTSTCNMASVANASQADTFTFTRGTGQYSESYSIKSSTGKYLSGSASTASASAGNGNDYAYWYVEILDALPVTLTEAGLGYATLYSPVALDIPGGISAYYVSKKLSSSGESGTSAVEYKLVLTALVSEIPANTPVILVGTPGTTYHCALKYGSETEVPASTSGITGSCAAQVTSALQGSGTVFALQSNKQAETVGFYPWNKATTSGFKCYFVSVNGNATAYRFAFENEMENSLDEVAVQEASEAIYDLCGKRVADSAEGLPRGIYIRGGRKIIIK